MATTAQSACQTRTSVGTLGTLANSTYLNVGTITHNTNKNVACWIEVTATPGTVSGNKQLLVFAQRSVDGTNYETGPTSGTTATDEPNLCYLGALPLNSNSTAQTKLFDLGAAYGGSMPYASKIIVKNDSGAALSSGTVYYSELQMQAV